MPTKQTRVIGPALPNIRGADSLDITDPGKGMGSLKEAITHLVDNYSLKEYGQARGEPIDIEVPHTPKDRAGVLRTPPKRSFREEKWYKNLSPEGKRDAELEIAQHLHSQVRDKLPKIFRQFRESHTSDNLGETAQAFEKEFGHLPGDVKKMSIECVGHSLIFSKLASVIGFESGILNCPKHLVGVAAVGPDLLVSDIYFDKLVSLKEWDDRIMNETEDPDLIDWRNKNIPPGKSVLQTLQPLQLKFGTASP